MRDYYSEISKKIDYLSSHYCAHEFNPRSMELSSWITNRIDWCWKFRKITAQQKDELCNRMIVYFEGDY